MSNPFYSEGFSVFDSFDGYAGKIKIIKFEDFTVIMKGSLGIISS